MDLSKAPIAIKCVDCGEENFVIVNAEDFLKWQKGTVIQIAMPYLSPAEREMFITGLCSKCFDKLFPQCDVCEAIEEDVVWCGNCGNCLEHCKGEEGCEEYHKEYLAMYLAEDDD
jgi:hypothetical protein